MIYRTPTYCRDFRCIAGECKDSCCKGWEIDIDAETAEYYSRVDGEFGERLRSSIKNGSFVLTEDERCPFLNREGLCDIYTELGEENLCRICS
ncbi:flagellin lysine-N-methylase, partial [Ruminococcus flavefaciens]|uniref:flagellin lysine-N-methylase n=1 Tax=Ruminococcus flavefaciens TaxID=1265 RepID=UPI00055E8E5B